MMAFSFEIGTSVVIYHKKSQLNQTLDNSFGQILTHHKDNEEYWNMLQTQVGAGRLNIFWVDMENFKIKWISVHADEMLWDLWSN